MMETRSNPEKTVEMLAKILTRIAGFYITDPFDGSPNWWMFVSDAQKIVDDLRKRFPAPNEERKNDEAKKEEA